MNTYQPHIIFYIPNPNDIHSFFLQFISMINGFGFIESSIYHFFHIIVQGSYYCLPFNMFTHEIQLINTTPSMITQYFIRFVLKSLNIYCHEISYQSLQSNLYHKLTIFPSSNIILDIQYLLYNFKHFNLNSIHSIIQRCYSFPEFKQVLSSDLLHILLNHFIITTLNDSIKILHIVDLISPFHSIYIDLLLYATQLYKPNIILFNYSKHIYTKHYSNDYLILDNILDNID